MRRWSILKILRVVGGSNVSHVRYATWSKHLINVGACKVVTTSSVKIAFMSVSDQWYRIKTDTICLNVHNMNVLQSQLIMKYRVFCATMMPYSKNTFDFKTIPEWLWTQIYCSALVKAVITFWTCRKIKHKLKTAFNVRNAAHRHVKNANYLFMKKDVSPKIK